MPKLSTVPVETRLNTIVAIAITMASTEMKMNFRLFFSQGIHPVHRAVFLTGLMSYLSAPLWCLFLVLSTALLAVHTFSTPDYFPEPGMLFPVWPQWNPTLAVGLFGVTALLLFLPKLLSVLLVWIQGSRQFGGPLKVLESMILESLFSMLLAPVRMLFHTRFVLTSLMGWAVQWRSPSRENSDSSMPSRRVRAAFS